MLVINIIASIITIFISSSSRRQNDLCRVFSKTVSSYRLQHWTYLKQAFHDETLNRGSIWALCIGQVHSVILKTPFVASVFSNLTLLILIFKSSFFRSFDKMLELQQPYTSSLIRLPDYNKWPRIIENAYCRDLIISRKADKVSTYPFEKSFISHSYITRKQKETDIDFIVGILRSTTHH